MTVKSVKAESFLQKKIQHYLDTTGLSIPALERKAGLKINVARNILGGQSRRPSAQTLQALANAMDCTVQDLLRGESEAFKAGASPSDSLASIEYPLILQDALAGILKAAQENNYALTLREVLCILEEVYAYSIKKDPPKIDMDFIEWFIKRTIN